jgi:hypothetical protein
VQKRTSNSSSQDLSTCNTVGSGCCTPTPAVKVPRATSKLTRLIQPWCVPFLRLSLRAGWLNHVLTRNCHFFFQCPLGMTLLWRTMLADTYGKRNVTTISKQHDGGACCCWHCTSTKRT